MTTADIGNNTEVSFCISARIAVENKTKMISSPNSLKHQVKVIG